MAKRQKLTITRYVLPGTYVGQVYRPKVVNVGLFPRITSFIGRGVPFIVKENMELIRSFVYNEKCDFPTVGPYISVLNHPADGSQRSPSNIGVIKLYNQNGEIVNTKDWKFMATTPSGPFDSVEIFSKAFVPSDTYYIDYQSTSTQLYDVLPILGTRQITAVGDHAYGTDYEEHTDFENFTILGSPVADENNSVYPLIYSVDYSQGVTATLSVLPATVFTGALPASYSVKVANVVLGDLAALPAVPHAFDLVWTDGTNTGTINCSIADTTYDDLALMDGLIVTLANVPQLVNGQVFTLRVKQTMVSLNENAKYIGPDRNYYVTVEGNVSEVALPHFVVTPSPATVAASFNPTPTNSKMTVVNMLAGDGSSTYTGLNPITYHLTVANKIVSGGTTTTFDFVWTDSNAGSGTLSCGPFTLNDVDIALGSSFGGINVHVDDLASLANGNVFTIGVTPSRRMYISWYSDDYLSQSGILDITENDNVYDQLLEAGVRLDFLNIQDLVVGDKWTIKATNTNEINWNFTRQVTQEFTPSDIYYDVLGLVTGTPRSYYITLDNSPVVTVVGTDPVVLLDSHTHAAIGHSTIPGTPYVKLNITSPLLYNFNTTYHYHNAPHPGQSYYVTASYTRPESMYNTVIIYTDYTTALQEIGYPSAENHLAVMLDYAFNVAQNDFVSVVQVYDKDHDGIYNRADYAVGLQATNRNKEVTDICVLGKFETIADQMYQSQICNDPLVGCLRLYWIGYPIGYTIGTPGTNGSIANYSANVLQVQGSNPAHGTFISCGNDWVKRTVILQSGNSVQLTLDGSFFAGMMSCINNAFRDPNTLLNNQAIPGIDDIRSYSDTEMEILGSASNTFANMPKNTAVAKVIDAVTTDISADDYHEINVMCVKQLVSKRVIRSGNTAVIGYVPRNVDDGVSFIRSVMARELTGCVGDGLIADYSDSVGRPRDLRPETDIDVWRDENDKTRWNFTYWFNGRYGIKRLTGMYSVDENAFQ